ncbi:uncharacterized protein RJT21DRAFT_121123 [Scheffersomyces amazonensis]|uniref:uncharacterized protein n=1 Tax=Scheffersomyces amazonensis TaxID=1078765 RepID=UPI00315D0236
MTRRPSDNTEVTSDAVDPQTTPIPTKIVSNDESDIVEKEKEKVDFTKGGVDKFKFYPDNPENHRHKYRWTMKEPSKFYDPCEESRQASLNCILRNQEDRTVCQDFFDAYKECKKDFFNKKRKDRLEGRSGWGIW